MNFDDIEKKLKEDGVRRANGVDKNKILSKALDESASENRGYQASGAPASDAGYDGRVAASVAMPPKKRFSKLALAAVMLSALALVGMTLMFVFYFLPGGATGKVPVYLGMQVHGITENGDGLIAQSSLVIGGDHTGRDDTIDQTDPFGGASTTVEAEIQSTLGVLPDNKIDYYAKQNEDILITVKLYNPDNYIILSFSLNGVFYQSYQFQDGSDSENLVLKTNVGEAAGIAAYTIDAIKYIDGNEIKDAVFSGDQTVKVGVSTEKQFVASAAGETVGLNSIAFNVHITDKLGLLELLGGNTAAVLFDGEKIVAEQTLKVGANAVSFEGLASNKVYQYAVYAHYNNLSAESRGASLNMLYVKAVATRPTVLFDTGSVTVGQESVSFALSWDEAVGGQTATYIDLYTGGQKVRSLSGNSANGLLSGKTYEIVLGYQNSLDIGETITLTFTTETKTAAAIGITGADATRDSITFGLDIDDPDNVGRVTAAELYNGAEKVASLDNFDTPLAFTGLDADTLYRISVTYTYDLNDGEGTRTLTEVCDVATLIDPIEITSVILVSSENPRAGEPVSALVGFTNAQNVTINSFYFGDQKVAAEIRFDGRAMLTFVPEIDRGELSLVPTAVEFTSKGMTRTMDTIVSPGVVISISITADTTFAGFYPDAGENTVAVGEAYDLIVELDNDSGYLANRVMINGIWYFDEAITQFGNNYIKIHMPAQDTAGDVIYNLTVVELLGYSGMLVFDIDVVCTVTVAAAL